MVNGGGGKHDEGEAKGMKHAKIVVIGATTLAAVVMLSLVKCSMGTVTVSRHFTYECQPKWSEAVEKEFITKFGYLPSRESDSLTRYQSSILEVKSLIETVKHSNRVSSKLNSLIVAAKNGGKNFDAEEVAIASAGTEFEIDENKIGRLPIECVLTVSAKSKGIADVISRAFIEALEEQVLRDNETICKKQFSRIFSKAQSHSTGNGVGGIKIDKSGSNGSEETSSTGCDCLAQVEFLYKMARLNSWAKITIRD